MHWLGLDIQPYLINLRRRGDKLEQVLAQCKSLHLHPTVVAAFDGVAMQKSGGRITKSFPRGRKLQLSWNNRHGRRQTENLRGEWNRDTAWATLGCNLSHKCVMSLDDETTDYTIVLEDDILVQEGAFRMVESAIKYLQAKKPQWKLLLLGGFSRPDLAPQTRNAKVCPRLCPSLSFAEKVYHSHAYVIHKAVRKEFAQKLSEGSASDSGLNCIMHAHVGECFVLLPGAVMQNPELASDIRAGGPRSRHPAAFVRRRGPLQVSNVKAKLPQVHGQRSTACKTWLAKVRKNSQLLKRPSAKGHGTGRGSRTKCLAQFQGCAKGCAKAARPNLEQIILKRWKQKWALCYFCQSVLEKRVG